MSTFSALVPGMIVRSIEDVIGVIERLESTEYTHREDNRLIVRGQDGAIYQFPAVLIETVSSTTEPPVVTLQLHQDLIQMYRVDASVESTSEQLRRENEVKLDHSVDDASVESTSEQRSPSASQRPIVHEDIHGDVLTMPVIVEQLTASKHLVTLGEVHVHKGVIAEEQSLTVPMYHEEAIVEHIPPEQFDRQPPASPHEMLIPVLEEKLVVTKRTVVKEYVRIRKHRIERQEEKRDTVRQEFVEISKGSHSPVG